MPRTITIDVTWRDSFTFTVADDYEAPNESGFDFGEDIEGDIIADCIDGSVAEMVDWKIR